MPVVAPDAWLPVDVESLEPTADEVVRETGGNRLVVAGPGAGKTELLAQRACFLLQTGICRAPRRILAISFKRDAAKNLAERVERRCGNLARRFDSFTLDAFAKSLVDRFRGAIPEEWRPRSGYEVMPNPPGVDALRDWIDNAGVPAGEAPLDARRFSGPEVRRTFDSLAHGFRLPYLGASPTFAHLGKAWWREQLELEPGNPSLSFPMLNRLAAYLLRQNPKVRRALRATYAFVFLDEFQDTTAAQYDLIRAAFSAADSRLTAVGDSKQRIMVWAGALADIFPKYETHFSAERRYLVRNYRSAPELVRMQHVIAQALEAGTPLASAAGDATAGSCVLMEFRNPEEEAEVLATIVEDGVRNGNLRPRDFCILVRQRSGEMITVLKAALEARGIRLRDESQLQDLLVEPAVKLILGALRLGTRIRDAEAWELLSEEVSAILGLYDDEDAVALERKCRALIKHVRDCVAKDGAVSTLPGELLEIVGASAVKATYRQYAMGSYLDEVVARLGETLSSTTATAQALRGAVDDLIGVDVVPAMTIHKSKGLEFHTVVFLGLEDSQWWAFANQAEEEKRGFFVAFSRASNRVYFTFCDVRDERWGRRAQQKSRINDLYGILQTAGVLTEDRRSQS